MIDKTEPKKFILDACCGGRMFWFDKNNPHTIFQDIRNEERGFCKHSPEYSVKPNVVGDFKNMKFPDKSFKLVVFDPPHLIEKGTSIISKKYGFYKSLEDLKNDVKKGFDECWRVLDDYGILIFKWNEGSVKRKEIIELIGKQPLFGQTGASNKNKVVTIWFCFMKIPIANPSTSATPTFVSQKEFNMGLEENSAEFSQIPANAGTSLNPNIKLNLAFCLPTL